MNTVPTPDQNQVKVPTNETKPASTITLDKKTILVLLALIASTVAIILLLIICSIFLVIYVSNKYAAKNNAPAEDIIQEIVLPQDVPFLGNKEAKVTIVEYADFQCPFCKKFHDTIFKNLQKDFIDSNKIKFVYQDFPFLGEESFLAAEAAACAKDQGKYWEFHNRIYEVQAGENVGTYIPENLKKLAAGLGLNAEQFNQCLDSHKTKSLVETSYDSAVGYGVEATPTIFINGKKLEGLPKYPTVKKLIEEELGK